MRNSVRRRARHVAVLIESSRHYGRGLIEGIARYSQERSNWSIYFTPRGLVEPAPPWFDGWKGDGVIARLFERKMTRAVRAKRIPVVDLFGSFSKTGFPMVFAGSDQLIQLAFEHLWGKGIRHFGYCGTPPGSYPFIDQRQEAFARLADAAGCSCHILPARPTMFADWEQEQEQIGHWLKGLPKPIGLLACYDERGFQVMSACRSARVQVPEEVALVSVGNDPVLCSITTPPMTSIDLDAPRIGYESAALLDRLMRGAGLPRQPVFLPPLGLVPRASTDMLAIEDQDVVAALRFIQNHACEGIRVKDVVRQVAVSISVLERKFRRALGRTPKAELLRVQVDAARRFLGESQLPLKDLAERCGFRNEKYFSDAFYRVAGVRPAAWRRLHRFGQGINAG